jgi:hypothetical protein
MRMSAVHVLLLKVARFSIPALPTLATAPMLIFPVLVAAHKSYAIKNRFLFVKILLFE